jgi:hypothetical protein
MRWLGRGAEGSAGAEVGHVATGLEEGGGKPDGAYVVFDVGFGVKMVNFGKDATRN